MAELLSEEVASLLSASEEADENVGLSETEEDDLLPSSLNEQDARMVATKAMQASFFCFLMGLGNRDFDRSSNRRRCTRRGYSPSGRNDALRCVNNHTDKRQCE